MHNNQKKSSGAEKQKSINNHQIINAFPTVGITGFDKETLYNQKENIISIIYLIISVKYNR